MPALNAVDGAGCSAVYINQFVGATVTQQMSQGADVRELLAVLSCNFGKAVEVDRDDVGLLAVVDQWLAGE